MKDPFVEEIRNIRMEHTRSFQSELKLISEDLKAFEKELGDRVVHLESKRKGPTKPSYEHAEARQTG
jgi:hypothetical protein